ncbi:MAG: hypothetical protein OXT67_00565 [Zetaproteobacteria bacterium]|nr:hypothetical protein [Zetaproteobacteria bacterium]
MVRTECVGGVIVVAHSYVKGIVSCRKKHVSTYESLQDPGQRCPMLPYRG